MKKYYVLAAALVVSMWWMFFPISESSLRKALSSSVVYVAKPGLGGGTGFVVADDHSHRYLVTNAHVCKAVKEEGSVDVMLEDGTMLKRPIVEISEKEDLCIIAAPNNVPALSMGSGYDAGDMVYVLGHPGLQPLTFSKGEITHEGPVTIGLYAIGDEEDEKRCVGINERIIEVDIIFGTIRVCVKEYQSIHTTVEIFPGNSGSPLVNDRGEVIGVMFAGSSESHWGSAVTLEALKDLINKY